MQRLPMIALAAILISISGLAQQPAQTQPTAQPAQQAQTTAPTTAAPPASGATTTTQTAGCSTSAPNAPAKPSSGFHFKIPKKVQDAIDKQRAQIENKTGVHVPTTDELKKQITQPPCPPGPAPAPATPAKPPAAPAVPPAPPAPTPVPVNAKP